VYLDGNQLFTQWIFHAEHLPATVEARFELYIATLVETYRALGIPAEYRPINDIHVNGRKIGGTGAARMDQAEVVVGSLMFDFDTAAMAQVLRVPSEKFRDKVRQSLDDYMTTMRRELGDPPARADVVKAYLARCAELLGRDIVPGKLRGDELALAEQLDRRFTTREWLEEGGGLRRPGIKIHEGVRVGEGAHKARGGLIRCIATVRDDRLEDVAFSGDFTALPASVPADLDAALVGSPLDEAMLLARVSDYYGRLAPEIPGVGPGDWVAAVRQATATEVPA
jgi:lipoate-protein ligase A